MRKDSLTALLLATLVSAAVIAQDTGCPAYPASMRAADEATIAADVRYSSYLPTTERAAVPPARNFIDNWIFKKLSADGVDAAALTTDVEFLRRVYLDLTGRIPTPVQTQGFLNDSSSVRRDRLVDTLLASSAYVDQFSHWHMERLQVRAGLNWIGVPAGINFYNYIRDFVAQDRPYNQVVAEMLSARGDSDLVPPMALLVRQVADYGNNPKQDAWDDTLDMASTTFLGVRTECISCHNGRGHLEKINVFLTGHTRRDLWKLSAFFARTRIQAVSDDNAAFRPRLILTDVTTGLYNGAIDPSRPGARPSREGANEEPFYWFTGQAAQGNAWRSEFATFLTSDRQFARATVNYLWAYFFGSGIVDPPDGWDFTRTDPNTPPPDGWTTQNSHPELLEALTDQFIKSNYSLKAIVRLIVTSNTYQLSSRYPADKWQAAFSRYFARHEARRLTAEQLFDSVTVATGTESAIGVVGLPDVLHYTNQLPYPGASLDGGVEGILTSLGRGDWNSRKSISKPSLFGVLDFMNNWVVESRTRSYADRNSPQSRLSQWISEGSTDDNLVRRLFMATLIREPSNDELQKALDRKSVDRRSWFSSLQWALIQKSDFVFSY